MYPVVGKHSGQHHLGVLEPDKLMGPYILPIEYSRCRFNPITLKSVSTCIVLEFYCILRQSEQIAVVGTKYSVAKEVVA